MNRDDSKFGAVFCRFWGVFAGQIQKWNVIDEWDMAQPFCSQQCIQPLLTQYFLPVRFIHSLLPSAPHANISARWDHHKMGSSHCNFMLLSHTGKKWSPQWLRNMKVGEEKSLSFSSCLFSMEKLVPLNDHFLAISHSEKLLLRFSSRNLHFYTVWGYST